MHACNQATRCWVTRRRWNFCLSVTACRCQSNCLCCCLLLPVTGCLLLPRRCSRSSAATSSTGGACASGRGRGTSARSARRRSSQDCDVWERSSSAAHRPLVTGRGLRGGVRAFELRSSAMRMPAHLARPVVAEPDLAGVSCSPHWAAPRTHSGHSGDWTLTVSLSLRAE